MLIENAYWQLQLHVQAMIYVLPVDCLGVEAGFLQQDSSCCRIKTNLSTINIKTIITDNIFSRDTKSSE